jgi:hypothetical protein
MQVYWNKNYFPYTYYEQINLIIINSNVLWKTMIISLNQY